MGIASGHIKFILNDIKTSLFVSNITLNKNIIHAAERRSVLCYFSYVRLFALTEGKRQ